MPLKLKPTVASLPLAQAIQWTKNWRMLMKNLVKPGGPAQINEVRAFNMTIAEIEAAINPPDGAQVPVSARIYLGCADSSPKTASDFKLIIVGVDANGEDILTNIGDFSHPCPTFCDPKSPLNG